MAEEEFEQRQRTAKYEYEARLQDENIANMEFKANQRLLEMLQNRLKEKEREYENLSFGNKVLWKLEKIKQNINDRDVIREKLKNLYETIIIKL